MSEGGDRERESFVHYFFSIDELNFAERCRACSKFTQDALAQKQNKLHDDIVYLS